MSGHIEKKKQKIEREDDNRQYQSIYDINYAETQQQAKLDNTSPQTSNTDMGMGGR